MIKNASSNRDASRLRPLKNSPVTSASRKIAVSSGLPRAEQSLAITSRKNEGWLCVAWISSESVPWSDPVPAAAESRTKAAPNSQRRRRLIALFKVAKDYQIGQRGETGLVPRSLEIRILFGLV